jgi:hypothetical protein
MATLLVVDSQGNPTNYVDTYANLAATIATAMAAPTPPIRIELRNS